MLQQKGQPCHIIIANVNVTMIMMNNNRIASACSIRIKELKLIGMISRHRFPFRGNE